MALPAILLEQWVEYPIGVLVVLLRLFARLYVVGWRNLYYDDLFAGLAMCLWTSEAVTIYLLNKYGTFIGLTTETADALTDVEAESLATGSKALFGAWMSYICLIWSLKTSVLFFYNRLTKGLKEQRLVRILGWFVGVSWCAMIMEILLQCRPVQKNWQIKPYAGDSCTLIYVRYYLLLILNVSTDVGLMAFIPAPILWKAQIPIRRKLLVALLLFSGIFIVAAAIIRCVMSVGEIRRIGTSGVWAIRETFVSIFAVNAPAIKPLFSRRHRRTPDNSGGDKSCTGGTARFGSSGTARGTNSHMMSRHTTHETDEMELKSTGQWSTTDWGSVGDIEQGGSDKSVDGRLPEQKGDRLRIEVIKGFTTSSENALGVQGEGEPRSWTEATGHGVHDHMQTRDGWMKIGASGRGITDATVIAER
ncbi:sedlin protein [Diplodia corticola]|uniref:Sedlin protein n=1 Tax=Diplodia corticola TaxID=236234 RepID=A0A1J9QMG3_9PEZI|nr:sedlin protein [Diplodia corticola]OJD29680.1 sedlin protein [Diplodia corticola]